MKITKEAIKRYVIPMYQKPRTKGFSRFSPGGKAGKRILWKTVQKEKFRSVLDVGCGLGFDTEKFTIMGLRCVGIDPIEGNIEKAKRRFPKGDFRLGFAHKLDFSDEYFDLVYAWSVIEILPQVKDMIVAIKECLRVAKKSFFMIDSVYPPRSFAVRRSTFPSQYNLTITRLSQDKRCKFTLWRCDKWMRK